MLQPGTIHKHLLQYRFYYLGIFVLYVSGFLIGSFYSNMVSQTDFALSVQTAEDFIRSAKENTLNYRLMLREDISPCLAIFGSGLVLFGFFGSLFFLFKAGFSAGFFLAFLVKSFSLKGFFLGSLFLSCQLLFSLPALAIITIRALRINLFLLEASLHRASVKQSLKSELFLHVTAILVSGMIVMLGVLMKYWLLPPLCRYLFA